MLGVDVGGALAVAPAKYDAPPRPDMAQRVALSPFVVVGRVNGQDAAARAATPAQALDQMLDWLQLDDDAAAVWYLREDWPTTLTVIGRPAAGLVGETRRSAHLFALKPGDVLYGSITACCGAELSLPEIEWLSPGAGMPCECCLALSGISYGTRPRLKG